MSGGIMQLVALGCLNKELNKVENERYVIKTWGNKYNNISSQHIELLIDNPKFGNMYNIGVPRNGDLLSGLCLSVVLSGRQDKNINDCNWAWINNIGYHLIKNIKLIIGGVVIQSNPGSWYNIKNIIRNHHNKSVQKNIDKLIGGSKKATILDRYHDELRLYIPLEYWFSDDLISSIRLISLQFHKVSVEIQFREIDECIISTNNVSGTDLGINIIKSAIVGDYVYLNPELRKQMAQNSIIYDIHDIHVVFCNDEQSSFSTYIKPSELIFVKKFDKWINGSEYLEYNPNYTIEEICLKASLRALLVFGIFYSDSRLINLILNNGVTVLGKLNEGIEFNKATIDDVLIISDVLNIEMCSKPISYFGLNPNECLERKNLVKVYDYDNHSNTIRYKGNGDLECITVYDDCTNIIEFELIGGEGITCYKNLTNYDYDKLVYSYEYDVFKVFDTKLKYKNDTGII